MKLEIGGGISTLQRGGDWVNLDRIESADIVHDLDSTPWPIMDDSVDEIYTSHCIEHVRCPQSFLNECTRIGKLGCRIEIRCPAPFSELMFVADHKSCFSPQAARNMEIHFPNMFWKGPKRPAFRSVDYHPSEKLDEAKKRLPFLKELDDRTIMEFIPGTAHECKFIYEVVNNEFFKG